MESGSVSSAMHHTMTENLVCPTERLPRMSFLKLPRLALSHESISLILLALLVLANFHPKTVSNVVQQIYTSHVSSAKIANLCALDMQAQADNNYGSEFTYWKAWVGAISNGRVMTSSESTTPKFISVQIPSKLTKHQAIGRARFYHSLYVGMRRQFLPQQAAVVCSISIYDQKGHFLAACDQNGIRS